MRLESPYLTDLVEACDHVAEFIQDADFEALKKSEMLRSAVVQKLLVIGEAAARVSETLKARHPEVPWAQIVGFRNVLIHGYFGIDWHVVWHAASKQCPVLREQVAGILIKESSGRLIKFLWTNEHLFLRSLCRLAAALAFLAADASSVCQVPQPRLVCAEYANSQAVVTAKLVAIREVGDTDGHFYTLVSRARLRGQVGPTFDVWEENSSGRATFSWNVGAEYLLFTSYSNKDRGWVIDGCGNSGPLDRSTSVLASIKAINTSAADGVLEGMASTDSWTNGVSDVTIKAAGNGTTFTAKTNRDGRFTVRLPAGRYKISAIHNGWSFLPTPFSYENPADLNLARGGCAQVHFSGIQNK
jgi:uncharacterized protein with HEPN domain